MEGHEDNMEQPKYQNGLDDIMLRLFVNYRSVFINIGPIGDPNGCFFLALLHRRVDPVGRSWRPSSPPRTCDATKGIAGSLVSIRTFCQQELRY